MAEKKTTQTKASMRNGRASKSGGVYNANHNTLEVTRKGQPHIDDQKFELNRYWKFEQKDRSFAIHKLDGGKGGFDSRKHELAVYERLYKNGLEARNERYTKEGHKDRCKTIKDLYSHPKTAPLETIFQIGNSQMLMDGTMQKEDMREKLTQAWNQTMRQVVAMGKGHVIPLDAALHCEEAVPHIHFRAALGATDKYGHFIPNQNKALEAMGFDGRNPETGQKDRYHNPLVAYTDKVREVFYQECEKLGLTIDREVTSESHRQVEILAYKCEAARKEVAAAQEQLRQMEAERDESVRAAQRAQEALVAAQRERDTTESRIKALRGSEAALVAKNEHLSEYNTKLEERKAVVITEGQAIVAENKQLKEANEKLSQDNKQLHQEDRNLRSQVRQLQEQVNGLTMQLGQLDMEKKQLEAETTQAKADRDAAVQAAKDIQNEQRQQYLQYAKGKEAKTFGEVPEQPEKRILGKVTQEARPACILVEKDDFKRLQKAAGYHYKVDYTQTQIDELDRKISEHDIIQGLEKKVQQQQFEINRLNGENSRMHQQKQKDEWTIEQLEQALGAYGIPNPTQQQQHHHRQRF